MILERPEVRAWRISAQGGIPEGWIIDRHPDHDRGARPVRGGAGGVHRLDRTVPPSKREEE